MSITIEERAAFDSALAPVTVLRRAEDVPVSGPSVVVNLAQTDAWTGTAQRSPLPPLSSTNLVRGTVTGELLLVIAIRTVEDAEASARRLGWDDFYGADGPVLLRSPQQRIGTVPLDRDLVLHQRTGAGERPYEVRANLWFSPAGTDCGIHNEHAFIEVHTQITGTGRMQKFDARSHDTIYEDQVLAPGTTNPIPFCVDTDGELVYPWHQYHADTDCVWLAVEYHAL